MRSEVTTGEVVRFGAHAAPAAPAALVRTPPTAPEAEIAVLAAILQNNAVLERVQARGLKADQFADARNGALFDACAKLSTKGCVANAVTLKEFVTNSPLFEDQGFAMLRDLQSLSLPLGGAADAAAAVVAAWQKREFLGILEGAAAQVYAPDVDLEMPDILASASMGIYRLEDSMGAQTGVQSVGAFFTSALLSADRAYKADGIVGVPTGLRDLDTRLGGLQETDLIIVAGRPSMGKTALATKFAFHAAKTLKEEEQPDGSMLRKDGGRTLVFSLEMSGEQLANRILSDVCSIPSDKIRRGTINDSDFPVLHEAANKLHEMGLYIDDTPALTVSKARAAALRLQRKVGKIHLIVIDYLQLMAADTVPGTRGGAENRNAELSSITRGLKALAKELRCAVVALSQLSRAVEQRDDKRPQLADLRESGAIEQDADVVMFTYREAYYVERAEPQRRMDEGDVDFNNRHENWQRRLGEIQNRGDVIVGKQRHGPIGTVACGWQGAFTRWFDLEHPAAEDAT